MSLVTPATEHWKIRAVRESREDPLLRCFVLAILGWQHGITPPRFGRVARINKEGMVFSNMQDSEGRMYRDCFLGPVDTIRDNFRGLADHLKLTDEERKEMFEELRKWFVVDERANRSNEERGLML